MNKKVVVTGIALGVLTSAAWGQTGRISGTEFNPAISLILDGRYTDYDENLSFELPGFMLGGEAGLPDRGFTTGHNELSMSANIDDLFYGKFTTAIVQEDGETEVELEEAWIESLGLGNGLSVRAGQFFSGIGYLNQQHQHSFDFLDHPLVYQAMFGGNLIDTGLQLRWLAPTDFYLDFGAEIFNGNSFPGGETEDGANAWTAFVKTGGDINESNSWQLGLSTYQNEFTRREAGAHGHGGEESTETVTLDNGDSSVFGVDVVYKWAPDGNPNERNFKFQAEYFQRDEDGTVNVDDGDATTPLETASYDGDQSGFYASAIYQFIPRWRVGVRYDQLSSDNVLAGDDEAIEDSGLASPADDPESISLMVDYSHSEFSRLRFQVTDADYGQEDGEVLEDTIFYVQYLVSLGAHGAHKF